MSTHHRSDLPSHIDNEHQSLPPTPHMRCVSRFSSWSSLHSSRPSSERASCGASDSESGLEGSFHCETCEHDHTTEHSQEASSNITTSFPEGQSPLSVSSDRLLQEADSGYGSPPAKSSHLAEPPPREVLTPHSSSPSYRWQAPWSVQSNLLLHCRIEGEDIEIMAVPADSLMDCLCRTCSLDDRQVFHHPNVDAKHRTVEHQGLQENLARAEDGPQSHKKPGMTLKGLRIWTPARLRSRWSR